MDLNIETYFSMRLSIYFFTYVHSSHLATAITRPIFLLPGLPRETSTPALHGSRCPHPSTLPSSHFPSPCPNNNPPPSSSSKTRSRRNKTRAAAEEVWFSLSSRWLKLRLSHELRFKRLKFRGVGS